MSLAKTDSGNLIHISTNGQYTMHLNKPNHLSHVLHFLLITSSTLLTPLFLVFLLFPSVCLAALPPTPSLFLSVSHPLSLSTTLLCPLCSFKAVFILLSGKVSLNI